MPGSLKEKKKMAFEWFSMRPEERLRAGLPADQQKMRRYLGIGVTTLSGWGEDYMKEKNRQIMQRNFDGEQPEKDYPKDEVKEVLDNLLALSQHNAFAGKTFLQAKGVFIEKSEQEVTHKFDAESYFRAREEAERRVTDYLGCARGAWARSSVSHRCWGRTRR